MIKIISIFIACLISIVTLAQQTIINPVDHPIRLSGTFGELRTNHFHAGIDIRSSNGRSGDLVHSVWDGHISRIHVSIAGYGNALYIDHPNGITSVYAHLHNLNPKLDSFLLNIQYANQIFEIDTILPDTLFPIRQGDFIGKMGTTGYSFGPHLHFELRTTSTERPINPLHYLTIEDEISPHIKNLYVYTLNDQKELINKKRISVTKGKTGYHLKNGPLSIEGPLVAFGVEAYDQSNKSKNKNGVFQLHIVVDEASTFSFAFDSLDFNYKTLINTHIDYAEKKSNNKQIHRCLLYDIGHPFLGDNIAKKGIVALTDTLQKIGIIINDINNNSTQLNFEIIGSSKISSTGPKKAHSNTYIPFHENVLIKIDDMSAFIEKQSFEHSYNILVDTTHNTTQNTVSPVYHIGKDQLALLKPMRLSYDLSEVTDSLRSKCFIAGCRKNNFVNHGSRIEENTLFTEVSNLGEYVVMIDTVAPTITPKQWNTNWDKQSHVSFIIKDNFDAKSSAKDLIPQATIDGQWILMKYDYKNDIIRYNMDLPLTKGPHSFQLKVTDDLGNTAYFNETIIKQ